MSNPSPADPGIWSRTDILTLLALLVGTAAIAIAIVTIRVMKSIDRKARRRALDDRPITQNTPQDFNALAGLCVTAAQSGLPMLEPWIPRQQLDDLLNDIPARLVLVGPRGSGKSRIATEAVKRLQSATARNILFWQQQLPSRGSLNSFNPHRPILIIDDLQPGSRKTDDREDNESDAVGAHLTKLISRLAKESGENEDSINIILTIWPDHLDWLKNELDDSSKFKFVDVANPVDDEKRQYVLSVEKNFQSVSLSADAVDELVKCSTYRDIFKCLRSLANKEITQPTVDDVERERGLTWKDELNSFKPRERLLFNILTVLGQFRLATHHRVVAALYEAGVRGACCERLTCQDVMGPASLLRCSLLKFDRYCQYECHQIIAELEKKRYVGVRYQITTDQQDALALRPGDPAYQDELKAVIKVFQSYCNSTKALFASTYWVPLLMQAGELFYKEGLFGEAIALDEWLLKLDNRRLPEPANETRSELLHYIGFNFYSGNKKDSRVASFYRRALDVNPSNRKAKHSLATLYRQSREYDRAIDLYQEILAKDPKDLLTRRTLLEFYLNRLAAWDDVEDSYKVLNEVWRSKQDTGTAAAIGTVLVRVDVARIVESKNTLTEEQFRESVERVRVAFREAIDRSTPQRVAWPHFYYGAFLYDIAGQADEGIAEMERALALHQSSYIRHSSGGKAFTFLLFRKLASCYESQAKIDPSKAQTWHTRLQGLTSDRVLIAKLLIHTECNEAVGMLKAVLLEHPHQWISWWFLGRTYEAMFKPQEAFDCFWRAAEGYNVPTYFSQLRRIVDGWGDPSVEPPPSRLSFSPRGLMQAHRLPGYHFRIFDFDLPEPDDFAEVKDEAARKWLTDFFKHCKLLKAGLAAAGWDAEKIKKSMLACSKKAYELDSEGAVNLKNLTDYAYDLMQAEQFSEALPLFDKARGLEESAGGRPYFALWQIGECSVEMSGEVGLECAKNFIRSAALENTTNVNEQLIHKLRESREDGEDLAGLFLDIFSENKRYASGLLIENLIPACLQRIWQSRRLLSQSMLDRLIEFEREHCTHEASEMVAVALQRNHQARAALPYFEKLDNLEELPEYVLISYKLCLQTLHHHRLREVSRVLATKQQARCHSSIPVSPSPSQEAR